VQSARSRSSRWTSIKASALSPLTGAGFVGVPRKSRHKSGSPAVHRNRHAAAMARNAWIHEGCPDVLITRPSPANPTWRLRPLNGEQRRGSCSRRRAPKVSSADIDQAGPGTRPSPLSGTGRFHLRIPAARRTQRPDHEVKGARNQKDGDQEQGQ